MNREVIRNRVLKAAFRSAETQRNLLAGAGLGVLGEALKAVAELRDASNAYYESIKKDVHGRDPQQTPQSSI